jgi:hypothetical protein
MLKSIIKIGAIVLMVGFVFYFLTVITLNFQEGRHRTSPANACINNLRQIDAAKNEWALEKGISNGIVATENDIKPYIKLDSKGNLQKCPSGGIYTIGKIGEPPTCSLGTTVTPAHVLP